MPLVSRTRAILRSAEFGFFGVIVRTWRQTPRFCGAPGIGTCRWRRLFQFLRIAGALILAILARRPWRTSWLIVGTKTLLLGSLPGWSAPDRASARSPHRRSSDPGDTKAEFSNRLIGVSNVEPPATGAAGGSDSSVETLLSPGRTPRRPWRPSR